MQDVIRDDYKHLKKFINTCLNDKEDEKLPMVRKFRKKIHNVFHKLLDLVFVRVSRVREAAASYIVVREKKQSPSPTS